jgi:hypothetical protein
MPLAIIQGDAVFSLFEPKRPPEKYTAALSAPLQAVKVIIRLLYSSSQYVFSPAFTRRIATYAANGYQKALTEKPLSSTAAAIATVVVPD